MGKVYTFELQTSQRTQLIDIRERIEELVKETNVRRGVVVIFCPHTTAGIILNEGWDRSVAKDIEFFMDRLVPSHLPQYTHAEGNSDSHIKASITGNSVTVLIEDGKLLLGRWQTIFFAEYDGPRHRKFYAKVIEG